MTGQTPGDLNRFPDRARRVYDDPGADRVSLKSMPTFRPESTAENLASQLRALRRSRRAQRTAVEGSARQLAVVAFTVPALALVTLIVVMLTVLLLSLIHI